MRQNESAPTPKREGAIRPSNPADDSTAELDNRVSAHPQLPATPAYLLIVEVRGDKYQRRPYMSLSSAEKAVERARSQGRYATVRLVACIPVPGGDR